MKYKKTTLPNGLRIITVPMKGNPAVTVMVMVETGSKYETKEQNGLSHFLEHMCFKGTEKRPQLIDIALEFDKIGASHNAFTSYEWTGYYAKAEKRHLTTIMDVVSDIYLHPRLNEADLETERGVIEQEIAMYEDRPDRQVWDLLNTLMYGDTPAGRTILGPVENIKRFTRDEFVAYRTKHYVAKATIVVVAGDFDNAETVSMIKKSFAQIPASKKFPKEKVTEKQTTPALALKHKESDQTHMVISFRSFGANNKRNPAIELLQTILGNGMSSRLFQRIRTQMGACYYIYSSNNIYTDHGDFSIATGIDAARAQEVVRAILEECTKLKETLIIPEELKKARDYVLGHLYMGLETSDSLAHFFAIEEATLGRAKQVSEIEKEIKAVTAKDIQKVAKELFTNEGLNLAIIGNISNEEKIKKVLSF